MLNFCNLLIPLFLQPHLVTICAWWDIHATMVLRDVVLTKKVWERIQKTSHFETASNSFWSKTWQRSLNAVPTRSRPATPLMVLHYGPWVILLLLHDFYP